MFETYFLDKYKIKIHSKPLQEEFYRHKLTIINILLSKALHKDKNLEIIVAKKYKHLFYETGQQLFDFSILNYLVKMIKKRKFFDEEMIILPDLDTAFHLDWIAEHEQQYNLTGIMKKYRKLFKKDLRKALGFIDYIIFYYIM